MLYEVITAHRRDPVPDGGAGRGFPVGGGWQSRLAGAGGGPGRNRALRPADPDGGQHPLSYNFV